MKGFRIELHFTVNSDRNEYYINIHVNSHHNYSYSIFNYSKGTYIIQKNPLINDWNLNFGDKKIINFRGEFIFFVHPIDYIPKRIDFEDNFLNYIFANYSTSAKSEGENNFKVELNWEDVLTNNKNPKSNFFANYRRMYPDWGPEVQTVITTAITTTQTTKSGGTNIIQRKTKKLNIVF